MSKVKNISGGPLDVPLLGRAVGDGETVEVPDLQGDGESPIVWPPDKWEPASDNENGTGDNESRTGDNSSHDDSAAGGEDEV